jgi:hypothetical protein
LQGGGGFELIREIGWDASHVEHFRSVWDRHRAA